LVTTRETRQELTIKNLCLAKAKEKAMLSDALEIGGWIKVALSDNDSGQREVVVRLHGQTLVYRDEEIDLPWQEIQKLTEKEVLVG
jgi:hypothetical protein